MPFWFAVQTRFRLRSRQSLELRPLRSIFKDKDHGWSPLLWVLYLGFFFIRSHSESRRRELWLYDALGAAVFLVLYLGHLLDREPAQSRPHRRHGAAGVVFQPTNSGACTFFIFAAAMLPFSVKTQKAAVIGLVTIGSIGAINGSAAAHRTAGILFDASLFPMVIGAGNIFFAERNRMNRKLRKANEEIEHLAKVAERERIARDLHDVLGHTLSVITLKSELAGKLIDRDPQRAGKEIREVEQISRQALTDVRDAIRGYRSQGLVAELAQAKATLETAGLTVQCDAATTVKLPAVQESVLSLAVREAVTNVVRHAQARYLPHAARAAERQLAAWRFTTTAAATSNGEGNGLRGMRERVEMLGGTLQRSTEAGTTLTITLPLKASRAERRRLPELNPSSPRKHDARRRRKENRKTIRVVLAEDQGMVLGALAALARH